MHKPCFKVRTQKLSHFGIKLSKILKNGRVATAFFKIFTKRNNDRKKSVPEFFPFSVPKIAASFVGNSSMAASLVSVLLPVLLENCRVAALFMGR